MKRLIPVFVALVLFGCNGKDSSLSKEEEIQKMLIENGADTRVRNSYFVHIERAKQMFPEIPDEKWNEIESLANDVCDSILKANVHLYAQHFSQDEIHEIRQFYNKPTGKKYFSLIEQLKLESTNLNLPEARKFEYAFFSTIEESGHSIDELFGTQQNMSNQGMDPTR